VNLVEAQVQVNLVQVQLDLVQVQVNLVQVQVNLVQVQVNLVQVQVNLGDDTSTWWTWQIIRLYFSMASIGPISAMLTPTRKYWMKMRCAKFHLNRARNVEYMITISSTTVSNECLSLRRC